jgi:hypothetical protein
MYSIQYHNSNDAKQVSEKRSQIQSQIADAERLLTTMKQKAGADIARKCSRLERQIKLRAKRERHKQSLAQPRSARDIKMRYLQSVMGSKSPGKSRSPHSRHPTRPLTSSSSSSSHPHSSSGENAAAEAEAAAAAAAADIVRISQRDRDTCQELCLRVQKLSKMRQLRWETLEHVLDTRERLKHVLAAMFVAYRQNYGDSTHDVDGELDVLMSTTSTDRSSRSSSDTSVSFPTA